MSELKLIGHRGNGCTDYFSWKAPQSTLLSFEQALEAGAHGIEFDVFKTKNGTPVVVAQPHINGVCVTDVACHELRSIRLPHDQTVSNLGEALDFLHQNIANGRFPPKPIINIELKGPDTAHSTWRVVEAQKRQYGKDVLDIRYSSFDYEQLKAIRSIDPDAKIQPTIATTRLFGDANVTSPGYRVSADQAYQPEALAHLAEFILTYKCTAIDVPTHDIREPLIDLAVRLGVGFCTHPTGPRHIADKQYLFSALALLKDFAAGGGDVCLKVDDIPAARQVIQLGASAPTEQIEHMMGIPFIQEPTGAGVPRRSISDLWQPSA